MEVSGQFHVSATLPRERTSVFTEEEARCAPEPAWTLGEERNPCPYRHSNPGPSSPLPGLHPLTPTYTRFPVVLLHFLMNVTDRST